MDEVKEYTYDANGNEIKVKNTKTGETGEKVYDLWEFGGIDRPDVKLIIKWREKGKKKQEVLKLKDYSVRKYIGNDLVD